ncbi:recombination mediator RecR, partial [Roseateles sp. GG27B]
MTALEHLIEALRRLPGVGQKSAQRMAYHLLQHDRDGARRLALALQAAVENIGHCQRCHTFSDRPICAICDDAGRNPHLLCVVETPADQSALERTNSYRGYYFVLLGRISPLDGVGAREIGAAELLLRAAESRV